MDLICFSHLRWTFVYQRPQHLMSRFARNWQVSYFEEPGDLNGFRGLEVTRPENSLSRLVPFGIGESGEEKSVQIQRLLDDWLASKGITDLIAWYYTPMALVFSRHLKPKLAVYDCMDELSAFRGAPEEMTLLEKELLQRVDLVFTGGRSLYEAKKAKHREVHLFPSSVDFDHFAKARQALPEPADQAPIPRPRVGYFGVIDERMDLALLDRAAQLRPEWQFVMVGPTVKILASAAPYRENIHYLGMKSYSELPAYLAGWDVALLPFASNAATRYLSPTKIPEYLAGGKPVVATPIADVVDPYGAAGLVSIAADAGKFVGAIETALAQRERSRWLHEVDHLLKKSSWENTWKSMNDLITAKLRGPTDR